MTRVSGAPEAAVAAILRDARGAEITGLTGLSGGDINHAARVDTTAGPYFLKWNNQARPTTSPGGGTASPERAPPGPGMFEAEAMGLHALRASGTRLAIPEVIGWSDSDARGPGFLITTFLSPGRRQPGFDETLGVGLAELHAATRPMFGFELDNYIGATPQPNPAEDSWLQFYRAHRLAHQVRLARDGGRLDAAQARALDRLGERLDRWLNAARPALIHGDLWSGNLHADEGRPALIDPAPYYGHPEAELGMMTLFGGFSEATYAAYAEASGLDPDWRARAPLYQLYHVLNHANLFGGGYAAQAMRIVRGFVG